MNSRTVTGLTAVMVVASGLLTACSDHVAGQATPTPSTSVSTSPSASTDQNPFVGMSPCKLLDQVLAGQGFAPAKPSLANPQKACDTQKAGQGGSVGLILDPGRKIDENIQNPAKAASGDINGRKAIQDPEPLHVPGDCNVWMEVKQTSRAGVFFNAVLKTTDEACQSANDVATKVEPLLPKD